MRLAPQLDQLADKYAPVLVRRVDLSDIDAPVRRQAGEEFGLRATPMTRVYGKTGEMLGEIVGAKLDAIEDVIKRAVQ